MGEVYAWFAGRYGFDHAAMKSAGRDWIVGATWALSIFGVPLLFILMLGSAPENSMLSGAVRSLPQWLPGALLIGTYGGFLMAGYSWMLRRVSKQIRRQL